MKHIKLFEQWLRESFAEDHPKNTYVEMSADDASTYADEIIGMINTAYATKGGHYEFKTANDIKRGEITYWVASDIDADPEADVVLGGKETVHGTKMTVMGQDGSSNAKKSGIRKMVELMKTRGFYAEMDKDLAQKMGLSHIHNEKLIRSVIQKEINYNNDGSYERDIAGHKHSKVLVGIPK